MITFMIDLLYVIAGLVSVLYFRTNDFIVFGNAVAAYALLAVLFQFFAHIIENCLKPEPAFHKKVLVIIMSFILAFLITQSLVPIPSPMGWC